MHTNMTYAYGTYSLTDNIKKMVCMYIRTNFAVCRETEVQYNNIYICVFICIYMIMHTKGSPDV